MNLFELSGLLTLITSLSMGVFVLYKTPKNFTNRIWAYFTFLVAGWGLSVTLIATSINAEKSLLVWQITNAVNVAEIPILFLYFVYQFLHIPKNLFLLSNLLIALYFVIECLLGNVINHVVWVFNSFYSARPPTFLYIIYFIWWVTLIFYCHYLLIKNYRKVTGLKREQIKYFFLATSIGFSGGITCFFSNLGLNLYPYGNLTVPIYPLIMTYAILKYNLMDINVIIRKSLIYSLLVTTITFIFFIFVLISEHLFHQVIHYQNVNTSFIIVALTALIFTPLKNKIQNLVDLAFFKATTVEMAQQNEQLRETKEKLTNLYDQADKLSKTDTLTEINNRRNFLEMLNKKMQDCEVAKTSFYLVIFDVDHFKEINDTYGHIFGDKVLVDAIKVVKNNTRSNDFIGRYGGDEFIICLDFPNKEGILPRLIKIQDDVKALSLTHNEKRVSVSISIGAAKFIPGTNITEEKLIEKTDFALYKVKKNIRGEINVNE